MLLPRRSRESSRAGSGARQLECAVERRVSDCHRQQRRPERGRHRPEPGQRGPDAAQLRVRHDRPGDARHVLGRHPELRHQRRLRRADRLQRGDRRRQLRLPLRRRQSDGHRLGHERRSRSPSPTTTPARATGSKDVTVNNVAPSVVVTGARARSTRARRATYTFDTTDPGTLDTFTRRHARLRRQRQLRRATASSSAAATGDGSFDCRFADDNPTGHRLRHSRRSRSRSPTTTPASGTGSQAVTVNNVAPSGRRHRRRSRSTRAQTAAHLRASTRPTRARSTRSRPARPTAAPAALRRRQPIVFSAATGDGSFDCRFADDNPTGTASDTTTVSDHRSPTTTPASGTGTKDVTVNNVAPSGRASPAPEPVNEGQTLRTYALRHDRPGHGRHVHGRHARAAAPAASSSAPIVFSTATGDGSFNCRFADDNPTGTASDTDARSSITITDDDTGSGTGSKDVTVNNVDPSVVVTGPSAGQRGPDAAHLHLRHDRPGHARHVHGRHPDCGTSGVFVAAASSSARRPATATSTAASPTTIPTGTASDTTHGRRSPSPTTTPAPARAPRPSPSTTSPRASCVTGPSPVNEGQTCATTTSTRPTRARSTRSRPARPTAAPAASSSAPIVFSAATGDGNFNCRFADDNPTGTASDTHDGRDHHHRRRHRLGHGLQGRHRQQRRPERGRHRPDRSTRARRCATTRSTRPTRARSTRSRPAPRAAAPAASSSRAVVFSRGHRRRQLRLPLRRRQSDRHRLRHDDGRRSPSPTTTPGPTPTR